MMVASGRGAQLGIFLKGYRALEAIRSIDTVVFDKTGTLTTGHLAVTAVTAADGWRSDEVLALAAAVESGSEHAIATAIPRPPASPIRWRTSARCRAAGSAEWWDHAASTSAGRVGSDSTGSCPNRWRRRAYR